MKNPRTYGNPPFRIVVVHGGPGGGGEMAPMARELQDGWGVLEPLQTETTLEGQVEELKVQLDGSADLPAVLIGFSWGAWLSFIVVARHPELAMKLVLVGSGSFESSYAKRIQTARLSRLSTEERAEHDSILELLGDPDAEGKDTAFARLGALASKTDTYDPIDWESDESDTNGGGENEFHTVLAEAQALRRTGELLELGKQVRCPVVAIHGDYDPHPVEGVRGPLSSVFDDFRVILLKNCGHKPWIERQAKDQFYDALRAELQL